MRAPIVSPVHWSTSAGQKNHAARDVCMLAALPRNLPSTVLGCLRQGITLLKRNKAFKINILQVDV